MCDDPALCSVRSEDLDPYEDGFDYTQRPSWDHSCTNSCNHGYKRPSSAPQNAWQASSGWARTVAQPLPKHLEQRKTERERRSQRAREAKRSGPAGPTAGAGPATDPAGGAGPAGGTRPCPFGCQSRARRPHDLLLWRADWQALDQDGQAVLKVHPSYAGQTARIKLIAKGRSLHRQFTAQAIESCGCFAVPLPPYTSSLFAALELRAPSTKQPVRLEGLFSP